MDFREKLDITKRDAILSKSKGILDYVAFKITQDTTECAIYTNDLISQSDSSKMFLSSSSEWKFLLENELVIFSTTKLAAELEYSYEYKLKSFSEESPYYLQLVKCWDKENERKTICYFSKKRVLNTFENGGVWFIGIEKAINSAESIIKIYFRTFYENCSGDRLFTDNEYIDVIKECDIHEFTILANIVKKLLCYGMHVYMVAWNYDRSNGSSKYKIYCAKGDDYNPQLLDAVFDCFKVSPQNIQLILSFLDTVGLKFAGFSVSLDTNGQYSVNLYYKGDEN